MSKLENGKIVSVQIPASIKAEMEKFRKGEKITAEAICQGVQGLYLEGNRLVHRVAGFLYAGGYSEMEKNIKELKRVAHLEFPATEQYPEASQVPQYKNILKTIKNARKLLTWEKEKTEAEKAAIKKRQAAKAEKKTEERIVKMSDPEGISISSEALKIKATEMFSSEHKNLDGKIVMTKARLTAFTETLALINVYTIQEAGTTGETDRSQEHLGKIVHRSK